jgi:hypothetical protein
VPNTPVLRDAFSSVVVLITPALENLYSSIIVSNISTLKDVYSSIAAPITRYYRTFIPA